ncbi:MAG TPA: hypothetical protein VF121_00920 [Thermoanaerobaculia bacterium]|nr:hypothetical protein [Thermoanaerobaculia bacterium]
MRRLHLAPAAALLLAGCSAWLHGSVPLRELEIREPSVAWQGRTLVRGDLDGDGAGDYALAGRKGALFVVGILQGPPTREGRHWTLEFPVGGEDQDALCSPAARLRIEKLEAVPPGATAPPGGHGLTLSDERCDAFHIYWDPERERFAYWRL